MNNIWKEFVAEFLGTFILMVFGISGCATNVLSHQGSGFIPGICYGLGATVAIFFCGPISGAHINPAITLALCIIRKTSWHKFPIYLIAQYLGAFLAAAVEYGLYFESIQAFDNELNIAQNTTGPSLTTSGIFSTLPAPHLTLAPALGDTIISTGLLALGILFITDESCYRTPPAIQALSIGFQICATVVGFGYNCGAILNPARDLAPRLFLAIVGYGKIVFEPLDGNYWWVVAVIGTHVGAIIGAIFYLLLSKMRTSYVDCSHQIDMMMPQQINPERDLIYQKARIVINENIKNLSNQSPPHSRY
ncbi:hypothetical protein RDWZM_004693 [Blomia tropicalis]|uniref:Aquaporin n=1 Tax=Blomia tropicalis TaxID=40697 RepID=A0A1Z1W2B2_BLOTA|nr:aquaporin [Blomia tropicalis]KAJ6218881.1 hypothetical protein RDWZM_004693 [Blomia tropicalis]